MREHFRVDKIATAAASSQTPGLEGVGKWEFLPAAAIDTASWASAAAAESQTPGLEVVGRWGLLLVAAIGTARRVSAAAVG